MDIPTVLTRKFNAQWILEGDNYDGLIWLDDSEKPTKKQLEDLYPIVVEEIQAEIKAKEAKRQAVLDKLGLTAEDVSALGIQLNL